MKSSKEIQSPLGLFLAVSAAASLAAWALEESAALLPALYAYSEWFSLAALALDAVMLVLGLVLGVLALSGGERRHSFPWIELISSLPVIILSSAPLAYAYLEGRPDSVPAILLAARSLRILRLNRVIPGSSLVVLWALAVCEGFRSFSGSLLPDAVRFSASLRLILLPEAMLVLAATVLGRDGSSVRRVRKRWAAGGAEPVVGEDELAGLLGKRGSW